MNTTDHLLIQLTIGSRTFSINVDRDKEQIYREAAKMINFKLQQYISTFSDLPKQDYMSMVMLDIAVNLIEENNVNDRLKSMINLIDKTMENKAAVPSTNK